MGENKPIFWKSLEELKIFAESNKIVFAQEEEIIYDIDKLEKWCSSSSQEIDCNDILNLWNIFIDLHDSVGIEFVGNMVGYDEIYDKLFFGNNLLSINKTKKKYVPIFLQEEIKQIKEILMSGINMVLNVIS